MPKNEMMDARSEVKPKEPDMAQWILGQQMAAAIMCLNAPFCGGVELGEIEPVNRDPAYIKTLAKAIKDAGASKMAIEDAMQVLQECLDLHWRED